MSSIFGKDSLMKSLTSSINPQSPQKLYDTAIDNPFAAAPIFDDLISGKNFIDSASKPGKNIYFES